MENFRDFLNEELKDPELKAEYEALEQEYMFFASLFWRKGGGGSIFPAANILMEQVRQI